MPDLGDAQRIKRLSAMPGSAPGDLLASATQLPFGGLAVATRKAKRRSISRPAAKRASRSSQRPPSIAHWTKIEGPDDSHYDGDDELMSIGARLGRHLGLTRIGINHERLPPGRRTSYPHAESSEEEFVYVIAGTPDVWLDGELHRLRAGDAVGFPAGTGLCHSFLNNTAQEVRLLVVGETKKAENRVFYPRNPEQSSRTDWWSDPPARAMADHDGLTDGLRARRARTRSNRRQS
jgi:uncharacterized cupin superfamily protein